MAEYTQEQFTVLETEIVELKTKLLEVMPELTKFRDIEAAREKPLTLPKGETEEQKMEEARISAWAHEKNVEDYWNKETKHYEFPPTIWPDGSDVKKYITAMFGEAYYDDAAPEGETQMHKMLNGRR